MSESLGDQRARSKAGFTASRLSGPPHTITSEMLAQSLDEAFTAVEDEEGLVGFARGTPAPAASTHVSWPDPGSRQQSRPAAPTGTSMMERATEEAFAARSAAALKLAAERAAELARAETAARSAARSRPPSAPGSDYQSSSYVDDSASERGYEEDDDDAYQILVPHDRLDRSRPGASHQTHHPAAAGQWAAASAAAQDAAARAMRAVNAGRAPEDCLRIAPARRPVPAQPAAQGAASATSSKDLEVIRACLPNLRDLSDEKIRSTDLALLIELNKARSAAQPPQGDFQSTAAQFLAAAAAQMGTGAPREIEPAVLMASNLEKVKKTPTDVPAGLDDRCENLHPARFLGGAICSSGELFVRARELLGVEGATALNNYDMNAFGLSGTVTMRGWKELQNPSSSHCTLKLFSPCNLQASTGSVRRLTLADADGGINVGEHLKEIADMEELKLAMRVLCTASTLSMPWNHSFLALDAGLHLIKYGAAELGGFPNRVTELVKFINHIIELNAVAWTQKRPFLTAGEIRMKFPEWLACSTVSLFKPADQQQSSSSGGGARNDRKRNRQGQRAQGTSGYQGGHSGQSGHGGQSSQGGHGGQGSAQHTRPAAPPAQNTGQFTQAPPPLKLCKRYNVYLNCPNNHQNCVIPGTTTRLAHLCSAIKANGQVCGGKHTAAQHR